MRDSAYGIDWFTQSLINAGLAQTKGRSGWNWWAVSLLLGPLATAMIVIWAPVTRTRPSILDSSRS
jgi:hypothetical protein